MKHIAADTYEHEESHDLCKYNHHIDAGIRQACDDSQSDNAQHIINDGSARMALPALVFNLPISFKVSTDMLTLVAVRMTPIKMFCSIILADALDAIMPGRLKNQATPNPPASGTQHT